MSATAIDSQSLETNVNANTRATETMALEIVVVEHELDANLKGVTHAIDGLEAAKESTIGNTVTPIENYNDSYSAHSTNIRIQMDHPQDQPNI